MENPAPFVASFETKKVNELYNAHRNIRALCALWTLGAVLLLGGLIYGIITEIPKSLPDIALTVILAFLGLLQASAVVGLYSRTAWGRILGMVVSFLSLVNFPIGTVIGAFCIYTLVKSPELFGPNRILPADLTAEYKKRRS